MGSDWKSSVTRVHSYDKDQKIDNSTLGTVTTSFKQEEKDQSRTYGLIQLPCRIGSQRRPDTTDRKMFIGKKVITSPFIINKKSTPIYY